PRARGLRRREVTGRLPRVGCPPRILARGWIPQRSGLLQPRQCLLPGRRIWARDRGLSQGQAVSPARPLSRGEFAPGALGRAGPPSGTASSVVETRPVLERLAVIPRQGALGVGRLRTGGDGGVRGPAPPPAASLLAKRGARRRGRYAQSRRGPGLSR